MKKIFLAILFALPATAQLPPVQQSLSVVSTSCQPGECAVLTLDPTASTATLVTGGTFVATQAFEATSGNGSQWTAIVGIPFTAGAAVSTSTATGGWTFDVAGKAAIRVRPSAYTSGTMVVSLGQSAAKANTTSAPVPQSLGTADTPVFANLGFVGTAAATLQENRNPTANTAGNGLTVNGGGATVGSTDKSGGDLNLTPGVSTGAAIGGTVGILQNKLGNTGTTDNGQVDFLRARGWSAITNNTFTTFLTVALPTASTMATGTAYVTCAATVATPNNQATGGIINWALQNTAGTVTGQAVLIGTGATIASSGTLAATTQFSVTGTNAALQLKCNSSLVTPTVTAKFASFNISDAAITYAW